MRKLILFLVIGIFIIGGVLWWIIGKQPVNPSDKTQKVFVVAKNQGIRDIGYTLKQDGLIRDPIVFFLTVKQLGLDNKIQAGSFRLSPSMTLDQVAMSLTHGSLDMWVTIPEGKRAEEVAELLAQKLPGYTAAWIPALKAQEGYLFPDTYLFPVDTNITMIIKIMRGNFDQKYQQAQALQTTKLAKEQAVILASILEREAITKDDMRDVASVLENRLAIGMPLGIDATVQYALGFQPKENTWWKKDLTIDDLAIKSPYNTRLNAGLPPAPISNPGLTSLQAVLNPTKTNYLYYVSDKNGKLHFAETLDQHSANIKKYLP